MSAFSTPRDRSRRGLVYLPPAEYHMVAKASGGIGELYKQIKTHTVPVLADHGYYTDHNGCFDVSDGQCILALRYKFLEVLGTGQSAVVIKAKDMFNSDKTVAVKILHTRYYRLGDQEMDCCRRLTSADPSGFSHVCRVLNSFSYDDHYCMVFELLHQPKWIEVFHPADRPVNTEEIYSKLRKVAVRLLQVLGFLQQQNVIHADLKPDNLLLKSKDDLNSLHVADFGNALHCVYDEVSLYYDDFELQTLLYRAPEVMFGLLFSQEIDMWSVGCILAEFFLGEPLFLGTTKQMVLKKMTQLLGPVPCSLVQRGKFYSSLHKFTFPRSQPDVTERLRFHLETGRSKRCTNYHFANFLSQILRYDPAERLTLSEAVCHPFLAPEFGFGYLFPVSTPVSVNENCGYPSIALSKKNYSHRPHIDKDILRQHPSSFDLLHLGTSLSAQHLSDENKLRLAEVCPLGFQGSVPVSGELPDKKVHVLDNVSTAIFGQSSVSETLSLVGENSGAASNINIELSERVKKASFTSGNKKAKVQEACETSEQNQNKDVERERTSSNSVKESSIKKSIVQETLIQNSDINQRTSSSSVKKPSIKKVKAQETSSSSEENQNFASSVKKASIKERNKQKRFRRTSDSSPKTSYKQELNLPSDKGRVHLPSDKGGAHLPSDKCRVHLPSDKVRVKLPSDKGGVHLPSDKGRVHLPSDKGGVHLPSDKGGVYLPSDKGGVPNPSDKGSLNMMLPFEDSKLVEGKGLRVVRISGLSERERDSAHSLATSLGDSNIAERPDSGPSVRKRRPQGRPSNKIGHRVTDPRKSRISQRSNSDLKASEKHANEIRTCSRTVVRNSGDSEYVYVNNNCDMDQSGISLSRTLKRKLGDGRTKFHDERKQLKRQDEFKEDEWIPCRIKQSVYKFANGEFDSSAECVTKSLADKIARTFKEHRNSNPCKSSKVKGDKARQAEYSKGILNEEAARSPASDPYEEELNLVEI